VILRLGLMVWLGEDASGTVVLSKAAEICCAVLPPATSAGPRGRLVSLIKPRPVRENIFVSRRPGVEQDSCCEGEIDIARQKLRRLNFRGTRPTARLGKSGADYVSGPDTLRGSIDHPANGYISSSYI
jgi:hypothetical protein